MNHGNGRHQAERTGKRIAYRLSLVLNIVLVVGILAFGAVKVAPKIMAMGGSPPPLEARVRLPMLPNFLRNTILQAL